MAQTKTSTKTTIPGVQASVHLPARLPRRQQSQAAHVAEMQRDLRDIHRLDQAKREFESTTVAELNRRKDRLAEKMESEGLKTLELIGTKFEVQLKANTKHTFDADIIRQTHELKCAKQLAIDNGLTTKDVTIFCAVRYKA